MSKYYEGKYYMDGNVVRWESNNSVPPQDILDEMHTDGVINNATLLESAKTRISEQDAFLAEYRERMANHVHSEEELFEMRAAFGEGAEVVNAITGQVTKL
jgi:hypothetical protein